MPAKKAKKKTAANAVKYSYDFGKKTDGSSKLRELLEAKVPISPRWPALAFPSLLVSPSPQKSALTSTTTDVSIPRLSRKK